MSDTYTIDELADALGINRYQAVWLKRLGKIPANAIDPDGLFIKSIINPFIEAYKKDPAPAKKAVKKTAAAGVYKKFSAADQQEAIRLMTEENWSIKQVSDKLGCSAESARRWKKNALAGKKRKKTKIKHRSPKSNSKRAYKRVAAGITKKNGKPLAPAVPEVFTSVSDSVSDFDAFVRRYWQQNNRAVEVLLSPSEIGTKILKSVNEALRFAYNELKK